MKKRKQRIVAIALAATMAAGNLPGMMPEVEAARSDGNAPFINTWLVAGPADQTIYGTDNSGTEGTERPFDGNWSKLASASANSNWSCPWHTHKGEYAVQKGLGNFWAANASDGIEKKELTITWKQDVPVKTIELYGAPIVPGDGCRGKLVTPDNVNVTLYDKDGKELKNLDITDIPDGDEGCITKLDEEIQNVRKIVLVPTMNESTAMNMAIGCVNVYDGKQDEPEIGTPPEDVQPLKVTVEANNVCKVGGCNAANGAVENAVDGNLDTAWRSQTHQGIDYVSGVMTLTAEKPSLLTEIDLTAYEDSSKNKFDVVYTLMDSAREVLKKGSVLCTGAKDDAKEITFGAGVEGVKYVTLEFEPISSSPNHLGIREVELVGIKSEEDGEVSKDIDVTPVLGEEFNGETEWQYFDDRIYNRNTDDYNDLYGYFEIKQGLDTTDKFVYAHTYVYSPKDQDVELRYGVSGVSKVFVNDTYVGGRNEKQMPSVNELYKDKDRVNVQLKSGWNKILFEIQHVMTPDKKQSPWEMVHFMKTKYMGLYARLTDAKGNEVEGLEYSVTGGETEENKLEIVTQGLDIDKAAFEERNADIPANEYFDNELPIGYTQWPYVWNKAIYRSDRWAPQASKFQFQAAGGAPEYTWSLEKGTLPPGLTLNEDGTIDGYLTEETGEYPFTVKVTDAKGNEAVKETKIIVKERPNKWLEEAGADALTHCSSAFAWYFDDNFSYDAWAERAKDQGLSLVAMESMQIHGKSFWPTKSIDPAFDPARRDPEALEEVDGKLQVKDGLMPFKEAAERHGLKFGLYYGFYYTWQEIVDDLIERYNPSYFFFDGNPQSYENADIAWSMVRSYNDDILIQSNDQKENGDNDMTILEGRYYFDTPYLYGGYWEANMLQQNKYTVEENWNGAYTRESHGENTQTGLDWRLACKAFVNDLGHGYVRNWDQTVADLRTRQADMNGYVKWAYDQGKLRDQIIEWYKQPGTQDKRETLFGTTPYTFDYEKRGSDWHDDPELAIKYGEGPEWGYVLSRDNKFYMHMLEIKIPRNELTGRYEKRKEKVGFTGQKTVEAGPFDYEVTSVEWFNEGKELPFEKAVKNGKHYAIIDTSFVKADPVDTIIKVETADTARDYKLSGVKAFSDRVDDTTLQMTAECTMNNLSGVVVNPEKLSFTSSNSAVASVDGNGVVTAKAEGKADITVTAVYEGVTEQDTYPVKVDSDMVIHEDVELDSAVIMADDNEYLTMLTADDVADISIQGRTERGGSICLDDAEVTYHYATVDEGARTTEVKPEECAFDIADGTLTVKEHVEKLTRFAVWADVTVDGKTYTTNKLFVWVYPSAVLSDGLKAEVSSGKGAEFMTDDQIFDAKGDDNCKWTPDTEDKVPAFTYDLGSVCKLDGVNVYYNGRFWRYQNTPKTVTIEVSKDGENWTTAIDNQSVSLNNTNWHFEDKKTYSFSDEARYVRVSFPEGAQDEQIDIMEVEVLGYDVSNALSRIEVEKELSADKKAVVLDVKGFTGMEQPVDLTKGTVSVTSNNENVAIVEGNAVKAVAAGSAKICVTAKLNGFKASEEFYIKVNKNGEIRVLADCIMQDLPVEGMKATAGSEETGSSNDRAGNVLDSDNGTIWHTQWSGTGVQNRWIDINLGESKTINGLRMLPRQSGENGMITKYRIEVSNDNGATYKEVKTGTWDKNAEWKTADFAETKATNVRLYAVESVGNYASAAEIRITTLKEIETVNSIFEVTVNGETTEHRYNDAVTVTAQKAEEGMKFAGWEVNGKIVSYEETYKFYVSENVELTAKYVKDEEVVKTEAKAMISNVFVTKRTDEKSDVKFVGELVLPKGYKVVKAGLIWSSKDTPLLGEDGSLNSELKPTYISKISDTNQFSVTIKGMPQGKSIRGRIFAVVTDGTTEKLICSDEEKADAAK